MEDKDDLSQEMIFVNVIYTESFVGQVVEKIYIVSIDKR